MYGLPFCSRVQSYTGKSQCQLFRFLFCHICRGMVCWDPDHGYVTTSPTEPLRQAITSYLVQMIRITVQSISNVILTLAEARFSASSLRLVAGKNTTLSMVWISSSCTTQRIRREVNNSSAVLSENGDKWQSNWVDKCHRGFRKSHCNSLRSWRFCFSSAQMRSEKVRSMKRRQLRWFAPFICPLAKQTANYAGYHCKQTSRICPSYLHQPLCTLQPFYTLERIR